MSSNAKNLSTNKNSTQFQEVINVNGLNKKDGLQEFGTVVDWKDLAKWMSDQEKYFKQNRIESEELKLSHLILHIDVRHWSKLEKFFRNNQRSEITFDLIKNVLVKKVRKIFDPSNAKYDCKVDAYVDKLLIQNLNLGNLKNWMKKLRSLCDGQADEQYLTLKIMSKVVESKRTTVFRNLLKEINDDIALYESRLKTNGQQVGKEKKKELNKLKMIKETIRSSLD